MDNQEPEKPTREISPFDRTVFVHLTFNLRLDYECGALHPDAAWGEEDGEWLHKVAQGLSWKC
jgi:hypothetical protein